MPVQGSLSVERMCRVAEVSRASFYRWLEPVAPVEEQMEVRAAIQAVVLEHRRRYGYRRVTRELRRRGMIVNHKRVARLMGEDNLLAIQPRAWALADRVLIREALNSLLGNAWKFTAGRDGAVIEFGITPAADARVCCFVRDNGAGFNPAYVDKLFTPFQRLHSTREFAGTGIGLACVREIVDRHHGRAWAEGTVGAGATFFFTLQAAEPAT